MMMLILGLLILSSFCSAMPAGENCKNSTSDSDHHTRQHSQPSNESGVYSTESSMESTNESTTGPTSGTNDEFSFDSSLAPQARDLLRMYDEDRQPIPGGPHTFMLRGPEPEWDPTGQPNPPIVPSKWWPSDDNTTGSPDNLHLLRSHGGPNMPRLPDGDICEILLNATIPIPANQVPYSCICSYCKGKTGLKGDRGDRGLPGEPGSPGRIGMTGFKGDRGFTGPQGLKGQKGDIGVKGQSGMTGLQGSKGERGYKGEKGDQGMMGSPGGQGPQGPTGTCPASCERAVGRPGPQGPPGPAGAQGLPGVKGDVGPKGMMGLKGDLGRPGDPGVKGLKGDEGEQGVCECSDGMDGADGQMGPKGDKGDKGDLGLQGEQGPMGLKGNQGDMGMMGIPGPCSPAIQSAFSASLTQSFPDSNQPVPFNRVLTNNQGHFDSSMGIYTAPVNGTYAFSFHLAVAAKPLKVGIFHNKQPLAIVTAVDNPGTCSQEVVVHLMMGDRVWLLVKDTDNNGMVTNSESSSTFSGYLLYPDSCEFFIGRNSGNRLPPPFPTGGYTWGGL